jgi:hypothetical protein
MDIQLFKDAVYSPEDGKLLLRMKIGKIHFKVIEPYTLSVSVCNYDEACEFLVRVGLGELALTCLEDRRVVANQSQGPVASIETVYGLLQGIGSFGASPKRQNCHSAHPDSFGGQCDSPLVSGECYVCGFQVGDENPFNV